MPHETTRRTKMEEWVAAGLTVIAIAGGWSLADDDLAWELKSGLETNTEDSFDDAKETLFNSIDVGTNNTILCRYSGTTITLVDDSGTLRPDPADGVQVEHTWASRARWTDEHFDRDSIPGADLHHLFAVRQGINGSRGNHPFGELPDTARELRINPNGTLNQSGGGIPSGSFRDRNEANVVVFEPRDDHKGDVARAMFYMSVRYWWPIPDDMEDDLRDWHQLDPPSLVEIDRNARIALAQGNRNPFVDDATLVERISDFE